jgi:hypothetical protein
MLKKFVGSFVFFQVVLLLAAGFLTAWYSGDLMTFLIHMVGEERALGRDSVIRRPDGSLLLTNPGAMALWTMPVLLLAAVQVSSAFTLAWLGYRYLQRSDGPRGLATATLNGGRP